MTDHFHASELLRIAQLVLNVHHSGCENYIDDSECNQLHYCVSLHSTKALRLCLKSRLIDVNQMNILGETPLLRALNILQMDTVTMYAIVDILLHYGADPNLRKCAGEPTALMLAVMREDGGLVRRLLEAGADVNTRLDADGLFLKKGDSALSIAVKSLGSPTHFNQSKETILSLLLKATGISPSIIFHAIQQTQHPALKHILLHGNLNAHAH
jgi:ankyrin repeat protein